MPTALTAPVIGHLQRATLEEPGTQLHLNLPPLDQTAFRNVKAALTRLDPLSASDLDFVIRAFQNTYQGGTRLTGTPSQNSREKADAAQVTQPALF